MWWNEQDGLGGGAEDPELNRGELRFVSKRFVS